MDDNPHEAELTIEEMVQLELCGVQAVIETVIESPPLFYHVRDRLHSLLDRLHRGSLLPEHAEVELEQIQEVQAQWLRDNPIPPD